MVHLAFTDCGRLQIRSQGPPPVKTNDQPRVNAKLASLTYQLTRQHAVNHSFLGLCGGWHLIFSELNGYKLVLRIGMVHQQQRFDHLTVRLQPRFEMDAPSLPMFSHWFNWSRIDDQHHGNCSCLELHGRIARRLLPSDFSLVALNYKLVRKSGLLGIPPVSTFFHKSPLRLAEVETGQPYDSTAFSLGLPNQFDYQITSYMQFAQ